MIEPRAGWRLAAMMALVYAVQGSFWPLLAVHLQDLGLNGRSRGWIFATLAMGSVIVPLGAGQLVDGLMRTQRFLTLAYGLGAALLALLASGSVIQEGWLFLLFLAFWWTVARSGGRLLHCGRTGFSGQPGSNPPEGQRPGVVSGADFGTGLAAG